jgi:hypothetical protein
MREDGIDGAMAKHRLDALIAPTGPDTWIVDTINGFRSPLVYDNPRSCRRISAHHPTDGIRASLRAGHTPPPSSTIQSIDDESVGLGSPVLISGLDLRARCSEVTGSASLGEPTGPTNETVPVFPPRSR